MGLIPGSISLDPLGHIGIDKISTHIFGNRDAVVADNLLPEVIETTKARGRGLDLWETAAELLVALEEMGWWASEDL